jgi:hypothetical protein
MLIRPTEEQLAEFGEPDFIIYNAGQFPANRFTKGMSSTTSVEINFKRMEMVILGTEYAGEMKKGVFSVMVCRHQPFAAITLLSSVYSTTSNLSNLANFLSTHRPTSERRRETLPSSLVSLVPERPPFRLILAVS